MITREILMEWVLEALHEQGGQASVLDVSKRIWRDHQEELRTSGDLFYTWQYDIRWAAKKLRDIGRLKAVNHQRGLPWTLM